MDENPCTQANDVLESLFMDENPIGDAGARHLMHALSHNKSLKFLGLQVRIFAPSSHRLFF